MFEGPVNLVSADIAGNFDANGAKFQNKENRMPAFGGMKIGGYAVFSDAVFQGPVNFVGGRRRTAISQRERAKFKNKEKKSQLRRHESLEVDAFFNEAVFEGSVNFNYAETLAWLDLSKNLVWPKVAGKFHMQGMSYKYYL